MESRARARPRRRHGGAGSINRCTDRDHLAIIRIAENCGGPSLRPGGPSELFSVVVAVVLSHFTRRYTKKTTPLGQLNFPLLGKNRGQMKNSVVGTARFPQQDMGGVILVLNYYN